MQIPMGSGFYRDRSLPISHQEAINVYLNRVQTQGALGRETLYSIPGIPEALATSGGSDQINRGSHKMLGIAYAVNGDALYRVNRTFTGSTESFSYTDLGTISGAGRVSMADNGAQLMILVPGGDGYIYTAATGVLAQITDADFTASGNPQYVIFIDTYFACSTDTKKWILSDINNGLSWDALQFGTAESDPDNIVTLVKHYNQVYILGSETTEAYTNIGGADFKFQRSNIFKDKGCLAPFSVINADNAFFMVGAGETERPAIWMFKDGEFLKISTTALDNALGEYTDTQLSNCFSWKYAESGAYFVGFTFTNTSYVYDMTSDEWHERKSKSGDSQSRWRVNSIVAAYGRILVFDAVDGRVGALDLNEYGEYGNDIRRSWTTMPFYEEGKEISFKKLTLTMESGVGNSTVSDPKITMEISRDAKTFGYPKERKIGKKGKYNTVISWKRNGRGERFMVLRFVCSDQIKFVAIKLEAE